MSKGSFSLLGRCSDPSRDFEVLCHGDLGPGNVIFENGIAKALIDWEFSAPGRRVWDLALALRYWAPLRDPVNTPKQPVIENFEERAQWILDGYQASRKMRIECAEIFTHREAKGGLERIERDKVWLARESQFLIEKWSSN